MHRAGEGLSSQAFHDAGGSGGDWAQHLFKGELEGLSVHRCFYRAGGSMHGLLPVMGVPLKQVSPGGRLAEGCPWGWADKETSPSCGVFPGLVPGPGCPRAFLRLFLDSVGQSLL